MRKTITALLAAAAVAALAQPAAAETTYSPLDYGTGKMLTCDTDWQDGVSGANSAWGNFIEGCAVTVECPARMQACSAKLKAGIYLESYNGERVTQHARLVASGASGQIVFQRDTSCDGANFCNNADSVQIAGGESATVQCSGVRQPSGANRAFNECGVDVEYLD